MCLMTSCFRILESPAYGDIDRVDGCSTAGTADQMLTISWHCSNQETELQQNISNNIHMEMNDIELPMQNKAELKLIDI